MRSAKLFMFAAAFAATACASTGGGSKGAIDSNATRITSEQITKANVPTAYDAVDRLHRRWFRDITTDAAPAVYLNNQKVDGGIEGLRQIPAGEVLQIDYMKSTDAMMKYGQDAKGGAIIVTRK
jgi:hypothetical protein